MSWSEFLAFNLQIFSFRLYLKKAMSVKRLMNEQKKKKNVAFCRRWLVRIELNVDIFGALRPPKSDGARANHSNFGSHSQIRVYTLH